MELNIPKGKQITHLAKTIATVELEVFDLCLRIGLDPENIPITWTVGDSEILEKYLDRARELEYQLGRLRALKLRQQSLE